MADSSSSPPEPEEATPTNGPPPEGAVAAPPPPSEEADAAARVAAIDFGATADLLSLKLALATGSVGFRHITQAWALSRTGDDETVKRDAAGVLARLLPTFEGASGGIRRAAFYETISAGVALTSIETALQNRQPAVHIEFARSEPSAPEARRLIFGALDLQTRALLHLAPAPTRVCLSRVYNVLNALLSHLEAESTGPPRTDGDDPYATFETELRRAERYYAASAERAAQLTYFIGTLLGLLPFMVIAAVLITPEARPFVMTENEELLAAALLAGAAGAGISVMTRVTTGKLVLSGFEEASRWTLRVFGIVRPVIGSVFGALLFFLIFGTVLDIRIPEEDHSTRLYFLIVLGFIAGFSERFAQDALAGAESTTGAALTAGGGRTAPPP